MTAGLLSAVCIVAASIGATIIASASGSSGGRPAAAAKAPHVTAATVPGEPRFFNYASPPGIADNAGEPSIGSNWTSEQIFSSSNGPIPNGGAANYFGGFLPYMVEVTFNDCQSPAKAIWDRHLVLTANTTRVYGDPILFTDHTTGRTFVCQEEGLTPLGSTTDFTDNDGDTFSPSQGSGAPSCVDHETIGGGPYHLPLISPPPPAYPNATYYASQCIADAVIALSLDGGVTFAPSVPMYTLAQCGGLHGHIKVGLDGTVYVPNKNCGGNAAVVVSENNGATWTIRSVPGSPTGGGGGGSEDPSVGVASDGSIYLGWQGADGHPYIAVSHNKGANWIRKTDVGSSLGIKGIAFPAVVAGDGGLNTGRAAYAFYGTTTTGAYATPGFPGVWYLYVATTYDGGATWTTQNVTPGDPIQRGGICSSGTCRNMLDFFDATIDKEGRVLVGWDDGCILGCSSGGPNTFSAKATITRQSGGKRMFAVYDPIEPRIPEAPALGGILANGTVHLSWRAPDNGGSDIVSYNLYRSVNGGSFTLLANLTTTSFNDPVDPTDVNHYRLTAVNALGEGPYCNEFEPEIPTPNACIVPGLEAVSDVNSQGTDLDAGQNTPPDPSVNIRELNVSEPFVGPGVNQLVFTLQMKPGGTLTPDCQWYIIWNRKTIAADLSDRRFVAMKTDPAGATSFVYGDFGPPLPIGGVPPPNANTPTPLGNADFGSFDPATGVMTIKLANSKADQTPLVAGDVLNGLNVRTFYIRPDAGQKSQNNAADITDNSSYTLVGNASCFCTVDQPPVAGLAASPTSGQVPLTVNFDASSSFDSDAGDGVASYTFTFADGSNPVTQASPTISHTYNVPSGSSGFFATVTVNDQKCGQPSLNVASVQIEVGPASTAVKDKLPGRFGIFPMSNPSHGQTLFSLDLDREGLVSVQVISPDGRRVADLMNSWMPAGKHSLKWSGLDRSGNRSPAGFYVVRARSGNRVRATRVVLLP